MFRGISFRNVSKYWQANHFLETESARSLKTIFSDIFLNETKPDLLNKTRKTLTTGLFFGRNFSKDKIAFTAVSLCGASVSVVDDLKDTARTLRYNLVTWGFLEKTREDREAELIMIIKRGILLQQMQEPEKAEQVFHVGLKLAQDIGSNDGITYIYDMLANLAFDTKQYDKAEKLFIEIMQRLLGEGKNEADNALIHINLKLAQLYEEKEEFCKAELGFKYCIEHLKKKVANINITSKNETQESKETTNQPEKGTLLAQSKSKENHEEEEEDQVDNKEEMLKRAEAEHKRAEEEKKNTITLWGMALNWYGLFLINQGRIKESKEYIQQAYDVCVQVNSKEHEQSAVLLSDLATIHHLLGFQKESLNCLQEAVKIGNKLQNMKDLAAIYVNLGQAYLDNMMYKECQEACHEGLFRAVAAGNVEIADQAKSCLKEVENLQP